MSKHKLSKKQKKQLFREVISSTPIPNISIENFRDEMPLSFDYKTRVIDKKGNVLDAKFRMNIGAQEQITYESITVLPADFLDLY